MTKSGSEIHRMLFVEGPDDEHVVRHLQCNIRPEIKFRIEQKQNYKKLIASISPEIAVRDRIAVGFVVDADANLNARWQAISERLRRRSIEMPRSWDGGGTIIEGRPRVGIWLMPDNANPGELEDFVATMVPDGDPVWPLAKTYIQSVPKPYLRTKRSKAEIHAWLATRERPFRMGEAIGAQALNTDGPLCQSFAAWLTRLFG